MELGQVNLHNFLAVEAKDTGNIDPFSPLQKDYTLYGSK